MTQSGVLKRMISGLTDVAEAADGRNADGGDALGINQLGSHTFGKDSSFPSIASLQLKDPTGNHLPRWNTPTDHQSVGGFLFGNESRFRNRAGIT